MTDPLQHTLRFFSPFDPEDEFEISFGEGDFPTLEFPHPSQINTMAVVHIRNGKVRGLGTCFAISSQGLVVTARHVMEQVNPTAADPTKENSEFFGALYISREKIPDSPGNYVGGILPIRKVWSNNLLDIALMLVELPVHKETGKPLPVAMMPLSPGLPETNQYCVGMGYSSMEWEKGKPGWPEVSQKYNATRGVIEEIHFPGRDQRLNFPCFFDKRAV